jgi:hypothetical protein
LISQRYDRSELRTKHAAARSRNGVVGSRGRKMPMIPTAIADMPTAVNSH